jgi:hypothetical protein
MSGAGRWTTTLSMRQRKKAFCCRGASRSCRHRPGTFGPARRKASRSSGLRASATGGAPLVAPTALLGVLPFPQGRLPAPFQLGGHQAVARVGLVELPLRQAGLVAEALELLLPGLPRLLLFLPEGGHGLGVQVQRRGGPGRRRRRRRRRRRWGPPAGSGSRAPGTAGGGTCSGNESLSCTARPSSARIPRSRRCRAAGPGPGGAPPGSGCGRAHCGCRAPWPGCSQTCPSPYRQGTCPGGRPSTPPGAAASARAGAGRWRGARRACGRRRRRPRRRGS